MEVWAYVATFWLSGFVVGVWVERFITWGRIRRHITKRSRMPTMAEQKRGYYKAMAMLQTGTYKESP